MSDTGGYRAFRQRLDMVLRRQDPAALREFLVGEGQWNAEAQTDVEAAMWMMIGTSPALVELRPDAERWLMEHGHASEAAAIFGGRAGSGQSASGGRGRRRQGGASEERRPQPSRADQRRGSSQRGQRNEPRHGGGDPGARGRDTPRGSRRDDR